MTVAPSELAAEGDRAEPPMISVLLPTRGRPASLTRMLTSLFENAARPDRVEAVLRMDDDDEAGIALDFPDWNVRRLVGPRAPMAELNTACLTAARGDILLLANDDVVVRTPGWDDRMRAAIARFPDGIYLTFPNDLLQGARLATFPGMSRETRRLLGEPCPKAFRGEFIDVHLMDVFQRLKGLGHDRVLFLEDVVFEHMHHRANKSADDATYRERLNAVDDHVYLGLQRERRDAAVRLRDRIAGLPVADAGEPEPAPPGSFIIRTLIALLLSPAPFAWRLRIFVWLWRRRLKI